MKRTRSTQSPESAKGLHSAKSRENLLCKRKCGVNQNSESKSIDQDDLCNSSEIPETDVRPRSQRLFQSYWLKLFKWLKYDRSTGIASCAVCALFPDLADKNSRVVSGYLGPFKLETFKKHNVSKQHKKCIKLHKNKSEIKTELEDENEQTLSIETVKAEIEFEEKNQCIEMNKSAEQSELIIPDQIDLVYHEDSSSSVEKPVNNQMEFNPKWLKILKWLRFDESTGIVTCAVCSMFPYIADSKFVQGFDGPYELEILKKHGVTSRHQECVDEYNLGIECGVIKKEIEEVNQDDSNSSMEISVKTQRSFKPEWLKILKWLRFDESTGLVTCAVCSTFPDIANMNSRFVQGYDGPYKLDTFKKHGETLRHLKCIDAYKLKIESEICKIGVEDKNEQTSSTKIIKAELEFEEEKTLCTEVNKSAKQSELIIPDEVELAHQEDSCSSVKVFVNHEKEKTQRKFKPEWLKILKWLRFDNFTGLASCAVCSMFPDAANSKFVQGLEGPHKLDTFKKHGESSRHQKCVDAYKAKIESEFASFTMCTELCDSNLERNDSEPSWSLLDEENDFLVPKVVCCFMWDLKKYTLVPKHAKVELDMFESASKPGAYERDPGDSDASSGRFVAPKTGFYNFNARMHIRLPEIANNIPWSEFFSVQICIDSSLMEKMSLETVSGLGPGYMMTISVNGLLYLKVSQYASVFVDNSSNYDLAFMDGSQFSGYLVGV